MPPDKGEIKNEPIDAGAERPTLHQLEKLEHIENIGAIFKAESRLQRRDKVNREDRFYFRIDNSEYRQRTGMSIEDYNQFSRAYTERPRFLGETGTTVS